MNSVGFNFLTKVKADTHADDNNDTVKAHNGKVNDNRKALKWSGRTKTEQLLEEIIGKNLYNLRLGEDFLDTTPKVDMIHSQNEISFNNKDEKNTKPAAWTNLKNKQRKETTSQRL